MSYSPKSQAALDREALELVRILHGALLRIDRLGRITSTSTVAAQPVR